MTSLVDVSGSHEAMMATDPSSSSAVLAGLSSSSSCSSFSSAHMAKMLRQPFLTGERSESHVTEGLLREKGQERLQCHHPIQEEVGLSKMKNGISPPPSPRISKVEQEEKSLITHCHSISTDGEDEEEREGEKDHRLLDEKEKPDAIKYPGSQNDEIFRRCLSSSGDSKVNCSEYSYPDIPKMSALKNRLCNPISDDLPLSSSPSISSSSLPHYYDNTQEDDSSEKRMFHGTPSSSSSFYKERHLSSSLHLSPLAERTTVVKSVGHHNDRHPSPLDKRCKDTEVVLDNSSLHRHLLLTGHSRDHQDPLPVSSPSSPPVVIPRDSRSSSSSGLKTSSPTCAQLQQFVLYAGNLAGPMTHASPCSSRNSMSGERKRRERRENTAGIEREMREVDDEENKTHELVLSPGNFTAVKKKSKKNISMRAEGGEEEDQQRSVKEENHETTKGGGEEGREVVVMEMKVEGSSVKKPEKKEKEEEAEENESHEDIVSSLGNLVDSLSVPLLFPSAVGTPQEEEDCLPSFSSSSSCLSTSPAFSSFSSSPSSSLPEPSNRPSPLMCRKEEEETSEPLKGRSNASSSSESLPLLHDAVFSSFSSSLLSLNNMNSRDLSIVNEEFLLDPLDSPLSLLILLLLQRGQSSHHLTNWFAPKDHLFLSQDEKLSSSVPSPSSPISKDSQSSSLAASFDPSRSGVFTSTPSIESEGLSVLSSYILQRLSPSRKIDDTLHTQKEKKASSLLSTHSLPKDDFSSPSFFPSSNAVPLSFSSSSLSVTSGVVDQSSRQERVYLSGDLLKEMREKNGGVEIDQNEDDSHRTWFSSSSPSFGCHPFHGRYIFSRFSSFSSPSSQQLREEKKKRTRSTSSESVESSEGRHMLRHEESAGLHQEENKKGSLTMDRYMILSTSSSFSSSSSLSPSKKVCLGETGERSVLATPPRDNSPQVNDRETSPPVPYIRKSGINRPHNGRMSGGTRREKSFESRSRALSTAAPWSSEVSSDFEERKMMKIEEEQEKNTGEFQSTFPSSSITTSGAAEFIWPDVSPLRCMVEQEERRGGEEEGELAVEGSPKNKSGERRQKLTGKRKKEEKEAMKDSHEREDRKRKGKDFGGIDGLLVQECYERQREKSLFSLHATTSEEAKKASFHCHSKQEDRRERDDPEDCQHARMLLLLSPVSSFSSSSSTSCEDHRGGMSVSRKKMSDEQCESLRRRPSGSSSVVSSNEQKDGETMNEGDDVEKEKNNDVSSPRRIRREAPLLTRGRSSSRSRESSRAAKIRLRRPLSIGSHLETAVKVRGGGGTSSSSSGEERAEEEKKRRMKKKKQKKEVKQTPRDVGENLEGGYCCLDNDKNQGETSVRLFEGVEGGEKKQDDGEVRNSRWRNKGEEQCLVADRGNLTAFLSSHTAPPCKSSQVCEDSYLGGREVREEVKDPDRRETESAVMARRRSIRHHPRKEEKQEEQETFPAKGDHHHPTEGCRSSCRMNRREEEVQEEELEEEKGYECVICSAVFARDSSLKHHLRTVHGGGDKPFACPLCKKTFRYNRGNLEQHIQAVHKGIKPFECKICKKTFSQKGNLGQHIRAVHAGKKPFQCPECLRAFSRKSHLTRHIESLGHRKLNMSPSPLPSSSFSASYGNENNSEQPVNTSR